MRVPAYLLRHTVTVEPYAGESAYGHVYDPPFEVRALVSAQHKLTRSSTGAQVLSTAQVITAPDLNCPPNSRITLPDGRATTALSVGNHTAPGLPVPACTEVMCE
ncbi:hypothetical protein ACWEQC_00420 [Streptomyces shenzhenensis]